MFNSLEEVFSKMTFEVPVKRITNMFSLCPWYHSKGYVEFLEFVHKMNDAVKGIKTTDNVVCSTSVLNVIDMLDVIHKYVDEYPPEDMGNQRYGNKSFRKWHERLVQEVDGLVRSILPADKLEAATELAPYLLDSFGNATRIDYGSGHEIAFAIFILCLFKLDVFVEDDAPAAVLRVFNKYLKVCRYLQVKYHMEPAGSRGVHALDDFQFLPFIWGSAQLIGHRKLIPDSYTKSDTVDLHYHESLFLEAVKYINETKKGPFHEHSNQLWNISAVPNWSKLNGGMFKMYEAEVLKAFPVVQHILFGSLFSFDKRPDAPNEPLERQSED